ncbi:Gfo/Idh/MocA family oxidoreductase [Roseimicrobium sp. ORNL1]|uniref:Gfo/Idh/MocA family protein n=1 Tax=Roseimicrobium sp. ORNL1 TaxID=2711231 RepID=UPI0013E17A52|nr:Gfo/Idh/MocA family oxidoreductase [Roseimicrobium sp. ORNL1]QIF02548.1 Gfo/Idh/MocA family oxidoreductase [Roseimicrobium sp. ORNL1]
METRRIGIIMNGVTGRMGTNQHLIRSILAIIQQGGLKVNDDLTIMPDPILTGRNEDKLRALAQKHGVAKYTTDLDAALADPSYEIFFDASGTLQRAGFVEKAVKAGKAIYCEKPTAVETAEAIRLAKVCEDAGVKNGVVQDKLWLPGIRKFKVLRDQGFFGKILSVRGEFGYWVFTGLDEDQPAQRPSWNYRKEDGGGIIVDMLCHWRYVVDNLFGEVKSVSCLGATHLPERRDERGKVYPCTSDDACYATFETDTGVVCQFNSSWTVRVRRDDLFTMQVDGTHGSAIVGLRKCWVQAQGTTPRPVWNPDIEQPINFFGGWQEVPDATTYDNAFKIQWELFLKHVVTDAPFRWTLREGAKGVQLAEAGLESWEKRKWIDLPSLD